MDTTIRNLDEEAYRRLKARAALEGKSVGEAASESFRAYVARPFPAKRRPFRDLPVFRFPKGNERLSEQIDKVLYGG